MVTPLFEDEGDLTMYVGERSVARWEVRKAGSKGNDIAVKTGREKCSPAQTIPASTGGDNMCDPPGRISARRRLLSETKRMLTASSCPTMLSARGDV
jgi:hypothetical protein